MTATSIETPPSSFPLTGEEEALRAFWTCVRTRPRWEKKFARWWEGQEGEVFLPTFKKRTVSHRKTRITQLPLFPGYVFVPGDHAKAAFAPSGCVAYLLKPSNPTQQRQLAENLWSLHCLLASGASPLPVPEWVPGQRVRITAGPLAGATGKIVRQDGDQQFVVWIDLLGVGSTIPLPEDHLAEPFDEATG